MWAGRGAHVVQVDVKLLGACGERLADLPRDKLTLGDELLRVVLCDNRLQHLVANRRQHALVVVKAETAEDLWEMFTLGAGEHTQVDGDHLQILGPRVAGNIARSDPHIEDVRCLQPRDAEVCSLPSDGFLDAGNPVKHNRAKATIDIVHRRVKEADARANTDGGFCQAS